VSSNVTKFNEKEVQRYINREPFLGVSVLSSVKTCTIRAERCFDYTCFCNQQCDFCLGIVDIRSNKTREVERSSKHGTDINCIKVLF